jgi:S-formylglutathione hydrolase
MPQPVPYAVIMPPGHDDSDPLPLCLFLMGGGGTRQHLIDCQPLFDRWWAEGTLAPMVVATPSAGMSYYFDDPESGARWESFLAEDFPAHLRATCNVRTDRAGTAVTGLSMGGYGALKLAFARPELFGVVAAIHPLLEPGFHDAQIGARNRLHHSAGGPPQLLGPGRDAALVEANNPANRVRANASAVRETGLAIYLEAGDQDFINAHDGAEFLHRVLWDLDIPHEYRLIRGADHGGPTLAPRMRDTFHWVGAALEGTVEPDEFIRTLRAQLAPVREQAAAEDPTTTRRYGILPDPA